MSSERLVELDKIFSDSLAPSGSDLDSNAVLARLADVFRDDVEEDILSDGPDLQLLLSSIKKVANGAVPSDDLFFSIAYLAHSDSITDYEPLIELLLNLLSIKTFRASSHSLFFSWSVLLLERLCTDQKTDKNVDKLLEYSFHFLNERTEDVYPPHGLLDSILRLIQSREDKVGYNPIGWPAHARLFISRLLRTRELPWKLQQACNLLIISSLRLLGPRFLSADELFTRLIAAITVVHFRIQLEALSTREPLPTTVKLLEEILAVAEDESALSDDAALSIATNMREALLVVAGYLKGRDENPEPLSDEHTSLVASFVSLQLEGGAGTTIPGEDLDVIIDWLQTEALSSGPVLKALLDCIDSIEKVDSRVLRACLALVLREHPSGRWREAEEMAVTAIEGLNRVDFYDGASLKEARERLEPIPVDKLKELLKSL